MFDYRKLFGWVSVIAIFVVSPLVAFAVQELQIYEMTGEAKRVSVIMDDINLATFGRYRPWGCGPNAYALARHLQRRTSPRLPLVWTRPGSGDCIRVVVGDHAGSGYLHAWVEVRIWPRILVIDPTYSQFDGSGCKCEEFWDTEDGNREMDRWLHGLGLTPLGEMDLQRRMPVVTQDLIWLQCKLDSGKCPPAWTEWADFVDDHILN